MNKKKISPLRKIGKAVVAIFSFLFVLFYFMLVIASNSILRYDYLLPLPLVILIQITMVAIIVIPIYLWYRNILLKESAKLELIAKKLGFDFIPLKQNFGSKYFNEKKHSDLKFGTNTRLILKLSPIIVFGIIFSIVFYIDGRFPFPAPIALPIIALVFNRHKKQKIEEDKIDEYLDRRGIKRVLKIGNISLDNVSSESKLNGVHVKDIMEKFNDEIQISVFDRTYTRRRNKNTSFIEDTIILIKSPKLNIPKFTLAPERFGSSIEKYFGLKDINIDRYPKFSSNYILSSDEEIKIREVFNDKIIKFFEENENIYVERDQEYILFTQNSSDPDEREDLFTKYLKVAQLFLDYNSINSSDHKN